MSEASAERLVKACYESAYQGGGIWKLARKNRRK